MKNETLIIVNKLGLHARASAKFVSLASEFKSNITLGRNGQYVNGKSIMGIMMLAAAKGTALEVSVEGEDEDSAIVALRTLVSSGFGEAD